MSSDNKISHFALFNRGCIKRNCRVICCDKKTSSCKNCNVHHFQSWYRVKTWSEEKIHGLRVPVMPRENMMRGSIVGLSICVLNCGANLLWKNAQKKLYRNARNYRKGPNLSGLWPTGFQKSNAFLMQDLFREIWLGTSVRVKNSLYFIVRLTGATVLLL